MAWYASAAKRPKSRVASAPRATSSAAGAASAASSPAERSAETFNVMASVEKIWNAYGTSQTRKRAKPNVANACGGASGLSKGRKRDVRAPFGKPSA